MDDQWQWGDETIERERTWIVKSILPGILPVSTSVPIRQGYVGVPSGLRVRIKGTGENRVARMILKTGHGLTRTERPAVTSLEAAELILDSTPYRIEKRRYFKDDWAVDIYEGKLEGLIKAEFEFRYEDQPLVMPPWMEGQVEVTGKVNNELLARLAYDFDESPGAEALFAMLTDVPHRIVVTGEPDSGRTAIVERLAGEFPEVFQTVPEARRIIIEQVGVSPPTDDPAALKRFYRAIGDIQRSNETVAIHQAIRDGKRAVLMVGGTMDGAMYLGGDARNLERIYMTHSASEYARYDTVFITTAETWSRASWRGRNAYRLASQPPPDDITAFARHGIFAWSGHPNNEIIANFDSWEEKYAAIREAVLRAIGL
ncbi:MAG: AAA family ATPase [Patescibacteria group bacterium]|nr:AAA family ATPase [Patescibacteria group bacterium]